MTDKATDAVDKPPAKKRLRLLFRAIVCVLLISFAALSYVVWDAYRFLTTPASESPREVSFTIKPGSTFIRVAWDLKKAGLITDVRRFQYLAQLKGDLGKIKAGEFLLSSGWTPVEVLWQITYGQPRMYRLSIREGLTWWETAKAVEEQGFATFEHFKAVIHDPEFLREHDIPFANAEGFLFPETYLLSKPRQPLDEKQARDVASVMVRMFWKRNALAWNSLPLKKGAGDSLAAGETSPYAPRANATAAANSGMPPSNATATSPQGLAVNEANATATSPQGLAANGANATATSPQAQSISGVNATSGAPAPTFRVNAALAPEKPVESGQAGPGNAEQGTAAARLWRNDGPQLPGEVDPVALRRLVTLASLVEKETGVPAERERVAGVYDNRLRLGMLLQCDPTIIYGVGPNFSGAIRRSQLDDERNPYNTYKHAGLPPSPICSPGAASLDAAAWPEKHEFLVFVATGAGDGGHVFNKTVNGHNRAVQEYRARMRGNRR